MLRDFKFLRRNSSKNEEIENVPANPKDLPATQSSGDACRPPLNTIQELVHNPKPEQDLGLQNKIERTPSKARGKSSDSTLPLRTPDKHGGSLLTKNRFGWAQKNEPGSVSGDFHDERRVDNSYHSTQVGRGGAAVGNGGFPNLTPRTTRTAGRATPTCSENNSTQSTPTKSVTKPPNSGIRSKADGNFNARLGNYAALYKGIPSSNSASTVVNTVEVPHFDLKEDPSFWINHNVQVIIRIRPLNSTERNTNGYNRCLKQESSQSITWIGQPETRFTFDHVACETIDQEMLFRVACLPMVENCLSGYNSCMFAYGQTGSGKTYTMLGEIDGLEVKPSPHRGMTPRIFEFLFARIQAEEESRRDESLKYNCKCSFLEIYNEQITDLLDPSSTNLLLREDVMKGVYVENLSEFEVHSVSDIIRLLTQGSANRKVAATNMNRESSRSHSVFTCVIESRWEKDATTNFRFARLNLVDLAGSERQKTSGAEGERLKEAANINKSLSTLGHVIMILMDVAHGKPRHVPYRDSRLTFLLQDSLGGNSKTMIIANVSPSICCTAETLNTLKFAQRAKLIQNNAVVNEDSTGDVIALQHQIRLLKEELAILKRQNVSRSLSFSLTSSRDMKESLEGTSLEDASEVVQQQGDNPLDYESKGIRISNKQLKSLQKTLAGALRREKMAETSIKQLEAEIEQLNRLVRQREEDTRSCKMMLRFREDKIRRLESRVAGSITADTYLLEENKAMSEEIQLLQSKLDHNPEVTRFASENIRLLDQLRSFQEFYEEGEREILLTEVSTLREQLLQFLETNSTETNPNYGTQPEKIQCSRKEDSLDLELRSTLNELEECRRNLNSCLEENAKLNREIDSLHAMISDKESLPLGQDDSRNDMQDPIKGPILEAEFIPSKKMEWKHEPRMVQHTEEILNLHLELDILKIILKEERSLRGLLEEQTAYLNQDFQMAKDKLLLTSKQLEDTQYELRETKSVIEALESQQILSINEMEDIRNKNCRYLELMRKQELEIMALKNQLSSKEFRDNSPSNELEIDNKSPLQIKLKRMHDSLEKAKKINMLYQSDRAFQLSNEEEMDEVRRQAEAETAEAIVCMQEELALLQHQMHDNHMKEAEMKKDILRLESELTMVQEKLFNTVDDNRRLSGELEDKDRELRSLAEEWELLTSEIEAVLSDGCEALIDATDQLGDISNSFPQKRIWISEQVGMMVRRISEKELLIEELGRCLEDASNKRSDMECMLKSLRSAALVITEAHQKECTEREKEIQLLTSELNEKTTHMTNLEKHLNVLKDQMRKASNCATVAFVIVNRLSELNLGYFDDLKHKDTLLIELAESNQRMESLLIDQSASIEQAERQTAELQETCNKLKQRLSKEQEHSCSLEQRLEDIEKNSISKTREQLATLQNGVSSIRSCMASFAEHSESLEDRNSPDACAKSFEDNEESRTGNKTHQDDDFNPCSFEEHTLDLADCPKLVKNVFNRENQKSRRICKNACDRDGTIVLLRKEIECALESLKEVQDEMARLHKEKKEMSLSEKQSQESIKSLTAEVLALQVAMSDFEEQSQVRIEAFNHKIKDLEETLEEAGSQWCQMKECLELEVEEAKMIAAQKNAEAFCILAKFEEAQDTTKEADIMINELLIANETMRLDIEKMKKTEVSLLDEKGILTSKVESLQSTIDMKHHEMENLVEANLAETRDLVVELDDVITEVQSAMKENFMSFANDLQYIKSQFLCSTKLVHSWLEKIWSEIVVKDCAMSVLHLCHMGILLETVTGLHAENGLLSHGLCESHSVISDLKEHNFKARRELEMCRILKGKLLADIKNSFDRISRKEEETGEITIKLTAFEKKIYDLQLQEELMLQRSNDMGSQLATLMRELDLRNTHVVTSLLDQEEILKLKVEFFESQAENLMANWCSKDFESIILASELEDMGHHVADLEKDGIKYSTFVELLKKEVLFLQVEAELKEHILRDKEVEHSLLKGSVQQIEVERQNLLLELNQKALRIKEMDESNKELEQKIELLKDVVCSNNAMEAELGEIKETKGRMQDIIQALEAEYDKVIRDLMEKDVASEFSVSQISVLDQQNKELQKVNRLLMSSSCRLQEELNMRDAELSRMQSLMDENESLRNEVNNLKTEISLVLQTLDQKFSDFKSLSRCLNIFDKENCLLHDFISSLDTHIGILQTNLEKETTQLISILDSQSVTVEYLECQAREVVATNSTLQVELSRKDGIIKGLLYDLSLLQESASNSQDQKDEIEEMVATVEALENELAVKSGELAGIVTKCQTFEAQLQEKSEKITTLELDLSKDRESLKALVSENQELRAHIEGALAAKNMAEEELAEKSKIIESLENEMSEMSSVLNQMHNSIGTLRSDMNELGNEKEQLQMLALSLQERLKQAEAEVEENRAIAQEAQQEAESRKIYVEDKEAEVKLLERSVEELERTVNVLENKVDILKREAERQRLEREELELELHAIKHQMQNVRNADADMKRFLAEKEKDLEAALDHIGILKSEVAHKDAEIKEMKAHISELNLHAEAQAKEYKQKFKALEAMAEQVKPESLSTHATSSSLNKSEKNAIKSRGSSSPLNAAKSRGSSSPFKCIGLGLAQQMKSENVEELSAARMRIEELASLLVTRQKEIFSLNARLAAAESMTHDVIRDLLGLKLDMTTCASMLDGQQVLKITEKAQFHALESQEKELEVDKLKKQLNKFIEERQGWLQEMDRKQAELVAAEMALEKLRQRDQLVKVENEILRMENVNNKNKVEEMEEEIKKLSGQQNLQQRIHHHAKIKEENNKLKIQNEELSAKLRKTEIFLSRVKEELARFRASFGVKPYIDIDEEQRLIIKLKENEEEKVELAQQLLGLCNNVLKAAGIAKPISDIDLSLAEEALEQLKNRISSLEMEQQDLKFKNRIINERIRLSELMPQSSSLSSRPEENRRTPPRASHSQAPFLSSFDR
ncbi:hypothetical protein L6164_016998 [Bauhinia variegata]|uniref:Uncharacterized protein n=1 Tax=Bauhinia variegata TaxID=167791 RepID=A0ACB9N8G3_BAUVA|nr:hypothetical protein L6164_016998 [Bauhinia variegata]